MLWPPDRSTHVARPRRIERGEIRRTKACVEVVDHPRKVDLPRPKKSATAQPLLSVRSRKLIGLHAFDADRAAIEAADLGARLGSAGEKLWAIARPDKRRPVSLARLYDRAAFAIFGPSTDQRVRYRVLEKKLGELGLGDELSRMLAALPRSELKALRARGLEPRAIFRAGALSLASWRMSPDPMNEAQLRRALATEQRAPRIDGFLSALSATDRGRLQAAELDGKTLGAMFDRWKGHRAHLGIIGAGMSGIAAANVALDAGVDVVVLESRDRPLGRVESVEVGGVPFEVGGAWVHNRFVNPLSDLARDLGYTLIPNDKFDFAILGGRPSREAARALNERVESLAAEWGQDPSAAPLSTRSPGDREVDRLASEVLGPLEVARELGEVSAAGLQGLVIEKDDALVNGGMGRMLGALAIGLPIRTDCPVEKIEWRGDEVIVTAKGERYGFDKLLITLSPAVIASGAIAFDPPLPESMKQALSGFAMSSFEKVLLRFDKNVFGASSDNTRGVGFDPNGHGFEVNLRIKGTNAATVLVGGDHAKAQAAERDDTALLYGLDRLAELFGDEIYQSFIGGERTRWTADPAALGAYAVPTVGAPADAVETLKQPLDGKIGFAGEHLGEAGWRASIPGAIGSGKLAAERILREDH
jgi:monoamine oxidase